MSLRLRYARVADWPPLAWLARCTASAREIEVLHGDLVEVTPDWFCEAVWTGDYEAADFDKSDVVFGSGARVRGERATFVSASSTVDRLHALELSDGAWVSNSLACLLATARAGVDPLYARYFEDFRTVRDGLIRYRPSLLTTRGAVRLTYYRNLEWDGRRLRSVSKPAPVRTLDSFWQYRTFLSQSLRALADNMADRRRRRPFTLLGTISTGYDSATAAVLGREVGLSEAITVNRARGGAADAGVELAARLGLTTHVVERDAWRRDAFPEVPFIASDAKGEDVYFKGAESRLAGRVLLTGFHGDGAWSRAPHRSNGDIVRKDQSGLSLSEYRLWIGFLHCPVPFIGIRQAAAINAISRSPEMARWDWPSGNSRPICRRILEEAGLPRHGFGLAKRAASVLLFDEGFLTPDSLGDYTAWLAERAGDAHGPARRPAEVLWRLCGRLVAPLAHVTPQRWPRVRAALGRVVEIGRRDRLFRYVFPWALARAQRRYEPGLEA
jgi:hypothetical protein